MQHVRYALCSQLVRPGLCSAGDTASLLTLEHNVQLSPRPQPSPAEVVQVTGTQIYFTTYDRVQSEKTTGSGAGSSGCGCRFGLV